MIVISEIPCGIRLVKIAGVRFEACLAVMPFHALEPSWWQLGQRTCEIIVTVSGFHLCCGKVHREWGARCPGAQRRSLPLLDIVAMVPELTHLV